MKLSCGCTPDASGYGYCDKCTIALRVKIWRNMDEKRKDFDRYIDPQQSAEMDRISAEEYDTGCSCHINPPCSYCMNKGDEDDCD